MHTYIHTDKSLKVKNERLWELYAQLYWQSCTVSWILFYELKYRFLHFIGFGLFYLSQGRNKGIERDLSVLHRCLLPSFREIDAFSSLDLLRVGKEKCPQMTEMVSKLDLWADKMNRFLGVSQTSSIQICHALEWFCRFMTLRLLEPSSNCSTSGRM